MALELKFNLCQSSTCTRLVFTDQTGAYNAITNTTGYDELAEIVANPATTDFETAELEITTPDNSVYTFDTTGSLISGPFYDPLFPGDTFPNADPEIEYYIGASDLGYGSGKLKDGIYKAVYTIQIGGDLPQTYTVTKYFLFTCLAECCVDKLYAKITPDCDCEKDSKLQTAIKADGYLCAAKSALACGKINLAIQLLKKVEYICANLNCKCC